MKITTIRGLAVGVVLAGCAIGLASPASAELTDGTYQLTYLTNPDPTPKTVVITSCGADCKRFQIPGPYEPLDYHLQGDTWTATSKEGHTQTIDNNTLAGTISTWAVQLTKTG
jgi:hypothetical protein